MSGTHANGFGTEEFFEAFKNFKVPGFDYTTTMNLYRKNIEALTQAQKAMLDMAKEITNLNTEFTRQMVQDIRENHKSLVEAKSIEERSQIATDNFKNHIDNVISHNQKVAAIWTKSCSAAGEKIQSRMQESVKEAQKMTQKTTEGRS